MKTKTAC